MNLANHTQLVTGYTMATDKTGREWLVVVAKGTFGIPDQPHVVPPLLESQVPLVMTDVFSGEPSLSAPLYEMEFAPLKLRCDVLLNGSCYAPGGRPEARVDVRLRVGALVKSFRVVGPRAYRKGLGSCTPSAPSRFTVMPIAYDCAYGGVDRTEKDPARHQWYLPNHVGVGYHPTAGYDALHGRALPNTEELNDPISSPDGNFKPMAFGPLARAWQQRVRWAGTYDQKWLDHQFPFLPVDFDERYFQCAPEDQQIDYPRGSEEVVLINLTPEGRTAFRLPNDLALQVFFALKDGDEQDVSAVVDTVVLEPDQRRFTILWRASLPLRRNLFEVGAGVVAWRVEAQRLKARAERTRGKRRFSSLAELVAWKRQPQP